MSNVGNGWLDDEPSFGPAVSLIFVAEDPMVLGGIADDAGASLGAVCWPVSEAALAAVPSVVPFASGGFTSLLLAALTSFGRVTEDLLLLLTPLRSLSIYVLRRWSPK